MCSHRCIDYHCFFSFLAVCKWLYKYAKHWFANYLFSHFIRGENYPIHRMFHFLVHRPHHLSLGLDNMAFCFRTIKGKPHCTLFKLLNSYRIEVRSRVESSPNRLRKNIIKAFMLFIQWYHGKIPGWAVFPVFPSWSHFLMRRLGKVIFKVTLLLKSMHYPTFYPVSSSK